MSNSLLKQANAKAAKKFMADSSDAIEQLVTDDKVAAHIFEWLASLKLLHGVPFNYMVPDEQMLPQESIRFFHLDINWVNALVDGAYSIGRNEVPAGGVSSLTNNVADAFYADVHKLSNQGARSKRLDHLGLKTDVSGETLETVTGFLLRSEVVSGWKGLQVNAFDDSHYPNNPENNPLQTLPLLRLEHLSDQVLLGIFEGDIYQLDIHEPSEGLHFGFDLDNNDLLSKSLRNPKDGTMLSGNDSSITNDQMVNGDIFRAYKPLVGSIKAGSGGEVVNMYKLSALLYEQLNKANLGPSYKEPLPQFINQGNGPRQVLPGNPENANPLVSSDFALQMVEGVGMVSFYNRD